jgi:hypothetical protein
MPIGIKLANLQAAPSRRERTQAAPEVYLRAGEP